MDEEELKDLYQKGITAYRLGETGRAIDLLMKVVEHDEQNHRAWNALGVALTKTGKYQDADLCFENAQIIDPDNSVYKRNRDKNAVHLEKTIQERILKDYIPLVREQNPVYLAGGALAILLFLVIVFLVIIPVMNPTPLATSAGTIMVTADLDNDLVIIKNAGGEGADTVQRFSITANNQMIRSPAGEERILGISQGSTLAIPVEELSPLAPDNLLTIRVNATFRDDSTRPVITKTLTLPQPEPEIEPEPLEAPLPYNPGYNIGDVLLHTDGHYILITGILPNDTYQVATMGRRNDGLFFIPPGSFQSRKMQEVENAASGTGIGLQAADTYQTDTFYQGVSKNKAATTAHPLFGTGDLVAPASGSSDVTVILGYDAGTDEYATDRLYPFHTGEWGYREDAVITWRQRNEVERADPARISRIAISRIGIGAESSQPGTPARYREGDIVAKDRGADADLIVILRYDPAASIYETDRIFQSYDGWWYRDGKNQTMLRSVLERDYPYRPRSVDLSLVRIP